MNATKLAEIKERAAQATEGPWEWRGGKLGNLGVKEAVLWSEYSGKINSTKRDAKFIAQARQDIPELLAEVERLRTEIAFIANVDMSKGAYDMEHVIVSVQSWAQNVLDGVNHDNTVADWRREALGIDD